MNDLDRRLKDSLNAVRDSYAEERQSDRFETRARFIERYRNRRRFVAVGSVALAGAALIAVGWFATGQFDLFAERERGSEVAGELPRGVVSSVVTGTDPVDSGIRTGGVWVANAADSTVSHVDPSINRIVADIQLDGAPQEVDVGLDAIWVAGFGRVTAIDPLTDEVRGAATVGSEDARLSISVGEGYIWTIVDGRELVRVDPATFEVEPIGTTSAPVDVAARDGSVWVLDTERGLMQLDPVSGELRTDPEPSLNSSTDVSAGRGVVWLASREDNSVVRFAAEGGGPPRFFEVRGDYIDMAVSESIVWVLSRPNGHALLTALDTQTANPLGAPLRLEGDPVEVSSGGGGVWVVARELGAILRIDPAAVAD
jgi:streptogramin lyase